MNERIKELATEAENYAHDQNELYGVSYIRTYEQKFAELIIRECVNAADEWYQYHNEIQWDPGEHIKQHFGIE